MALENQVRPPYNSNLYIQRDEEAKIRGKLREAKRGNTFLIQGPPGIGKTWLIWHVLRNLKAPFVYLDVLDEEWRTYYQDIRFDSQGRDLFTRTLVFRMLQKALQETSHLFKNFEKKKYKRKSVEDIYTLRERLEAFLANLSLPLYFVVDHVNKIPEEVRDEIKRFLLIPILDTNHILVLVGRSDPYFGHPIAIPEERIIDVISLFDDRQLKDLLAKYDVPLGGVEDTLKIWTDGHPLAASMLIHAWKSHRPDRWEDYREVFEVILRDLLRGLPKEPEVYIEPLHLLSWGKPAQWIKKSVPPEKRKEVLRLVRDLTQHAFCYRKEQPFYKLFLPNLFFMVTLAQLQCDIAKQIYERIRHMLSEEQQKPVSANLVCYVLRPQERLHTLLRRGEMTVYLTRLPLVGATRPRSHCNRQGRPGCFSQAGVARGSPTCWPGYWIGHGTRVGKRPKTRWICITSSSTAVLVSPGQ